VISLVAVVY
jgi:chromosome segregation ATPase